jgi:hypothetical protein
MLPSTRIAFAAIFSVFLCTVGLFVYAMAQLVKGNSRASPHNEPISEGGFAANILAMVMP